MSKDESKRPSGIADDKRISGIKKTLSERAVDSEIMIHINTGSFRGRICKTDDDDMLVLHLLRENRMMVIDVNFIHAVEWAR